MRGIAIVQVVMSDRHGLRVGDRLDRKPASLRGSNVIAKRQGLRRTAWYLADRAEYGNALPGTA